MATVFDLEQESLKNTDYRRVITTTPQLQLVLMSVPIGDYIKLEMHTHTTQFIRVEAGQGIAIVYPEQTLRLYPGSSLIIPAGTWHMITNTGVEALKLYTIYTPPEHPDGLVQATH